MSQNKGVGGRSIGGDKEKCCKSDVSVLKSSLRVSLKIIIMREFRMSLGVIAKRVCATEKICVRAAVLLRVHMCVHVCVTVRERGRESAG